ncbi:16S rRNA (cytosine(1402)-N(4))-methyltransferase [hydrothermal vent metagenome]|uniref:16S rRNA (Cytosine(1402)-N(4))-methyltransferase n=1 Tax=hydrothermal vent metagenome TaxID=652676 RepID=A0A3B1BM33_9ZZZZ
MEIKHVPVLLDETLFFLDHPTITTVLDATVGGGGHAEAILAKIGHVRILYGFDRDEQAVMRARRRLKKFGNRALIGKSHFADIGEELEKMKIYKVDAVLMDLGGSSFHFDDPDRGFSFKARGPLDMRMDTSQELTASRIVNGYSEAALVKIFSEFGEERYSKRIAKAIVRERGERALEDTMRLAEIVERATPKTRGRTSTHPATRIFQALRIAVNGELDSLAASIENGVDHLNEGGRIAVISFHSLEDRIVKQTLKGMTRRCVCPKELPICACGTPGKVKLLTKKPIEASEGEIKRNRRARSAKLRVAQRLAA